jgi:uncharacterized protein YjiS (DUF1127 family)
VNDTPDHIARLVADRHAAMTPAERVAILVSMRRSAHAIVESSLPPGLTREQRRYAIAKRFYGDELPDAALLAHAHHPESDQGR